MTFIVPERPKPWQLNSIVAPAGSWVGDAAAGLETGATGGRSAARLTGTTGWLTVVASVERFAASATSTASGAATITSRVPIDPAIDEDAPQAARHTAASMTRTNLFTTGYNAGLRRLSRLAKGQMALDLT
jgi:hypothetical protein